MTERMTVADIERVAKEREAAKPAAHPPAPEGYVRQDEHDAVARQLMTQVEANARLIMERDQLKLNLADLQQQLVIADAELSDTREDLRQAQRDLDYAALLERNRIVSKILGAP